MTGLLSRVGAFFLDQASTPAAEPASAPAPVAVPQAAAVLGAPAAVVPVAAACAGELRARHGASAALICIWRPGPAPSPLTECNGSEPPARSPAGATTPGARRLANRLTAHELPATACGRLAWVALDPDAEAAAGQVRRALLLAKAPLVLAVAGPRPEAFEPLLRSLDLAIAVLAADAEPSLRVLAAGAPPAPELVILPPLAPGPPRWAAMAGLARLRALPEVGR
jgi:hypothetical protein